MAYVKQTFTDGQVLNAAHLNYIESALAELDARLALLESGSGGGGTITFYYEDGSKKYTLTADAGMTWAEFIESDYNPTVECNCCGEDRKLIQSFEDMTGGDTGNGEVVGFDGGQSSWCSYDTNGTGGTWVCDAGVDDIAYVSLNETIVADRTYYCENSCP